MRKTTKGAIAVGAGVALLLGGAGTMAAWRVSAGVGQGTSVTSGKLDVVAKTGATGLPVWSWTNASPTTFDVVNSRIVPGDSVTRTQVFTVTARGDHLTFTGALDLAPTVTGDPTLVAKLTSGTTTTLSQSGTWPTGVSVNGAGTLITVTSGTAGGAADLTFDVKVTSVVNWVSVGVGTDAANTMNQTVNLAAANLVLTQS
ncbi:alternate-type signal peptide domain-containing protein [Cellulomonas sp. Root485]|jgi:alternate signal-mediated exported protein|uniref:alternate-type signal peptide domain-containing protein n=1 Tax=Cellulomonas sp. Root485 TaxID=1736546 RepID=UPI0009E9FF49|nr:alternate-type signal peptide domain-containing protein [Cellulomonas sp. Root485]